MNEVKIEDKENTDNIVTITDEDLQPKQITTSKESRTEPTQILADKSALVTMFDGYGNKTEKRYFNSHPRIQLVQIRTSTDVNNCGACGNICPMRNHASRTCVSGMNTGVGSLL